jgi:hypothetical protein
MPGMVADAAEESEDISVFDATESALSILKIKVI